MLPRMAVCGGTLASLPVFIGRVHASEVTEAAVKEAAPSPKKLHPKDLPIYGGPESVELVYVPEEVTGFRKNVSKVRKVLWLYLDSMQDTTKKLKDGYAIASQYASDTVTYVQEDSGVLQRAGIITVAGLGGIVAGYRGGYLRKAALAGAGMITAASICYPNQAVDITSRSWQEAKQGVLDVYNVRKSGDSSEKVAKKTEEKSQETVASEKKPKDVKTELEEAPAVEVDESKKDYGQSKAEDKDMYTTRGS